MPGSPQRIAQTGTPTSMLHSPAASSSKQHALFHGAGGAPGLDASWQAAKGQWQHHHGAAAAAAAGLASSMLGGPMGVYIPSAYTHLRTSFEAPAKDAPADRGRPKSARQAQHARRGGGRRVWNALWGCRVLRAHRHASPAPAHARGRRGRVQPAQLHAQGRNPRGGAKDLQHEPRRHQGAPRHRHPAGSASADLAPSGRAAAPAQRAPFAPVPCCTRALRSGPEGGQRHPGGRGAARAGPGRRGESPYALTARTRGLSCTPASFNHTTPPGVRTARCIACTPVPCDQMRCHAHQHISAPARLPT